MHFFSDGDSTERADLGGSEREHHGALDASIILLLIAFTFGIWFLCGAVRPMLADTNPSLIAHPAPASGPYTADSTSSRIDLPAR